MLGNNYDPELGAFLGPDPWSGDLGSPGSLGKFGYVRGNPLGRVDPDGRAEGPAVIQAARENEARADAAAAERKRQRDAYAGQMKLLRRVGKEACGSRDFSLELFTLGGRSRGTIRSCQDWVNGHLDLGHLSVIGQIENYKYARNRVHHSGFAAQSVGPLGAIITSMLVEPGGLATFSADTAIAAHERHMDGANGLFGGTLFAYATAPFAAAAVLRGGAALAAGYEALPLPAKLALEGYGIYESARYVANDIRNGELGWDTAGMAALGVLSAVTGYGHLKSGWNSVRGWWAGVRIPVKPPAPGAGASPKALPAPGQATRTASEAVLVDTNLLIQASEKGNAAALAAIRGSSARAPASVVQEFVGNVSTHAQRMSRLKFLRTEGIGILPRGEAAALRGTPEFRNVFDAARRAGHSVTDAELAAFARASGREALTAEKRLANFFNLSQSKLGVRIRRVR